MWPRLLVHTVVILILLCCLTHQYAAEAAASGPASSQASGRPVFSGHAKFPTSLFESMYFMPKKPTAQPRPAVRRLDGTWFPDDLNNPTKLPQSAPPAERVLPPPLHGKHKVSALVHDLFNIAYQLFRPQNASHGLCDLCRTGLSTLQTITHLDPEGVPAVLTALCRTFQLLGKKDVADQCALTFSRDMYGGPIAQVMSYGNFSGRAPDATLVCAAVPFHFCEYPSEELSASFLHDWFHGSTEAPQHVVDRWHQQQEHARASFDASHMLRVLHVSDLHVDGRYMVGSESNCTFGETRYCCHSISANENYFHQPLTEGVVPRRNISAPAQYWGHYTCDAPWSLIGSAFEAIQHVGEQHAYDLGLFTGDLTVHDDLFRYSHDLVEYSARSLFDSLAKVLGDAPLMATLGNHDSSPENFYAPHAMPHGQAAQFNWDSRFMARLWREKGWIDEEAEKQARSHYACFSVSPRRGLRVISLNSDFWYYVNVFNYIHSTNPDFSGMLRFLTDELFKAEERGERVWILGHVLTGWTGAEALDKPANLFYQIVHRFAPHTIAAIFFGHTHQDHFSVFYRAQSGKSRDVSRHTHDAQVVSYVAPSITPLTNVNPSFRVYKVDPVTFDVYDYDQYYTSVDDFDALGPSQAPIWRFLYSARDTYGDLRASVHANKYHAPVSLDGTHWPRQAPLNASFWAALTDEMEARPELVTTFALLKSRLSSAASNCSDTQCREANICYMRSATPTQGRDCPAGHGSVV